MANIFVFVPAFGRQITATTFEATHHLMSTLMQRGIAGGIATYSFPDIAELRNVVLSTWYDTMPASTHLLMVDADMGFAPDVVLDMLMFDEPVVGAMCPRRSLDRQWAVSGLGDKGEVRGGFLEVEALGAGVLMIRRDAVDRMIAEFPHLVLPYMPLEDMRLAGAARTLAFFDQERIPDGKVAEDIMFCKRWRSIGGRVWAAINHSIEHIGPHPFVGCFAKEMMRPREAAE